METVESAFQHFPVSSLLIGIGSKRTTRFSSSEIFFFYHSFRRNRNLSLPLFGAKGRPKHAPLYLFNDQLVTDAINFDLIYERDRNFPCTL